jgi:small subunit ribosomal protein S6
MPALERQYELVYIVRPDFNEEQVQAVITKYNGIITNQGGTLERTDLWERRRLAYEIKGQTEGIYIVTVFKSLPNVEAELRRVFRISEDTLRSIIVKPDEEIDTSVPSVQPRDMSQRQPFYPAQHAAAQAAAAAAAEAATAVAEPAPAAEPEAAEVEAASGHETPDGDAPEEEADEVDAEA